MGGGWCVVVFRAHRKGLTPHRERRSIPESNGTDMLAPRLAALGFLSCSLAHADVSYVNFSSTAGLTLVGSTATAGNDLRLTPDQPSQIGAVWATTRQDVTSPFTSVNC